MKVFKLLLILTLLTGCASFQVSTLNHDPIYTIEGSDAEITVIDNEFELQRLLRTDFNFRYDFAQYAISQPRSFDWNNRVLGNRYSFYNPYYSRSQMWNDWVWGYNWNSPHRWSPFGYDRWGYNMNYGWNNHGWNYGWNNNGWNNGWNNGFYNQGWPYWNNNVYGSPYWRSNRQNTSYINGRRGSLRTTTRNDRAHSSMIESTKRTTKPRRVIRTNTTPIRTRPNTTPIRTRPNNNPTRIQPVRRTNNVPVRTRPNTTPTKRTNTVVNKSRKN
jgi:hypothetical protein